MGASLAEWLGYPTEDRAKVPGPSIESFADVGYHFNLADIRAGDAVLDLGSGSGMDGFGAAFHAGNTGSVTGHDMTDEQLAKSLRLRNPAGLNNVSFQRGHIEDPPLEGDVFDIVISNGVINLSARKEDVFREVARVLTFGRIFAISDVICETRMPASIKSDTDLWASCIGGAMQIGDYASVIEETGVSVIEVRENPQYEFKSDQARDVCRKYGVISISLCAQPHN